MNATIAAVQTGYDRMGQQAMAFYMANQRLFMMALVALIALTIAGLAVATSTDTWANTGYDFVLAAAKGKFARSICIVGGIVGLMLGAVNGKPILALTGVVLAAFGFIAPTMIDTIFGGALI